MKKRWISLLLCLAVVLAAAPSALAAGAQTDAGQLSGQTAAPSEATGFAFFQSAAAAPRAAETFAEAIMAGLRSRAETIDVSQYHIPTGQVSEKYYAVLNDCPWLFYVDNTVGWSESGGYVAKIWPYYNTQDYPDNAEQLYEDAVAQAMAVVEGLTDPLSKVVALHDWLVLHAAYDMGAYTSMDKTHYTASYSAYGVMVNGIGVCQSYSLAFADLMQRAGVPVAYGRGPNHMWNMVQLDGKWYNIDVTWDDPVPNRFGLVNHKYLLLSTQELVARDAASNGGVPSDHTLDSRSSYDYTATSTYYNSFWWTDSSAPIYAAGDNRYVTLKNTGTRPPSFQLVTRTASGGESVLVGCSDYWSAGGNLFWPGSYSGLSCYGGKYYYNGSRNVYSFDPQTGITETVFTYDGDNGDIYGMVVDGRALRLAIAPTPNDEQTVKEYPLARPSPCTVLVDGVKVEFQMYALANDNGDLTNYINVRDLAYVLNGTAAQFNTYWDGNYNLDAKQSYTPPGSEMAKLPYSGVQPYIQKTTPIRLNGEAASMNIIGLRSGTYTYSYLGDLGKLLDFDVHWDAAIQSIVVNTDQPYLFR